VALSDS
jgi:hypothetical protein